MRLAQRNAIYDALKRRGQELKEVDQKRYRPQTRRQETSDSADKMHVILSTLEVTSKHDMSLTFRRRPRSPAGAPELTQGRPRTRAGTSPRKKRMSYASSSRSREFIRAGSEDRHER
jgi:hypothetical protein